ncbi:outer membrane protein OmpW [Morganella psychrotolerans]|uniref:outer membrane protein OmpW n=1 Tax=Morganella psychrotolerans TaxID=368603 RepID=UPI0039B0DDDB
MKKLSAVFLALATVLPSVSIAHQAGDMIIRGGTATVRPNTGSDSVLGLGSFEANNNTQLGLTFTYMATDNIGIELLAATPFEHKISLPGVGEIASAKHLPPTLMAQYYFRSAEDKLRPYLGVGVNYTFFFDEGFNDTGKAAELSDLSMSGSWGVAAQAGLDYQLDQNWLLNASVWWMNIETDVDFKAGGVDQSYKTRLDPFVFMFGAGYKF